MCRRLRLFGFATCSFALRSHPLSTLTHRHQLALQTLTLLLTRASTRGFLFKLSSRACSRLVGLGQPPIRRCGLSLSVLTPRCRQPRILIRN
eukprot:185292-Pleurochrysis_carterae.AAC.1